METELMNIFLLRDNISINSGMKKILNVPLIFLIFEYKLYFYNSILF